MSGASLLVMSISAAYSAKPSTAPVDGDGDGVCDGDDAGEAEAEEDDDGDGVGEAVLVAVGVEVAEADDVAKGEVLDLGPVGTLEAACVAVKVTACLPSPRGMRP